jgi:hypothetical protein
MSSDLFASHAKRNFNLKPLLIGLAALFVIAGSAYGLYVYSTPVGPTPDDILAVEVRDNTVLLLGFPSFTGDEFRQQVLGRGNLYKYYKVVDEAFFTYPRSSDEEFTDFISNNFYDITKVDFGEQKNGEIWLGDRHVPVSEQAGHFFRTNLANIHIDARKKLKFAFKNVNYEPTLDELYRLTNNSQIYGGRMITQVPERSFKPTMIFANHGIMVAKPGEPSMKRLAEDLLKDVGPSREERIQKLVDFVSNEIAYSWTEALGRGETLKRGDETLMTRTGDCSNKTILLASLLEQIGEEYILLYCPRHITVAIPQGNFANANKLDFTWNSKNWLIAETTVEGFQVGRTLINQSRLLTKVEYVQDPKNADVIYDANSYEILKFL